MFIEREGTLEASAMIDVTGEPQPASEIATDMLNNQRGPGRRWVELYDKKNRLISKVVSPATGGPPRLESAELRARTAMPAHLRKAARDLQT